MQTKTVTAFPGAEDFLDPATDRPQRPIMRFERFGRQPTMAFAHQLRSSARGDDRLFDRQGVVGFVGIDLPRLIRDDRGGDIDIGLVGRRRLDLSDDARILIGGDMRLVAMRGDTGLASRETFGHLEKYPFRAACKSDSKNLFEFDHRERVRWGNWVSLI